MTKQTEYAGVDYGLGKTNVSEAGIRFGVISQHSVNPDASEDIFQQGRDLAHEEAIAQFKAGLRAAMADYFSDHKWSDDKTSKLDDATEAAFDAVEQEFNDGYENGGWSEMLWERDGYTIKTSETDLWVMASPFYTHAQFCSPCAPGAGNLDTACPDGPKTYCLGHYWFDDSKAPYPVYSVATGELVTA